MKNRTFKIISSLLLLVVGFSACKEEHFFDTGVHKAAYNGTILSYLKSKPEYFDTLSRIIKIADMESVFDNNAEPVTFFAPPSASIYRALNRLNINLVLTGREPVTELTQIKPAFWKEYLSMYIFKGPYRLKDFPQLDTLSLNAFPGQGYTSENGRTMNIGVLFNDAGGVRYAGYRQLYISYIPDISKPQVGMVNIPVASSDIQPTNGVIHVLNSNKHNFGFNTNIFIDDAIASGISPAP
jgi:hypothetical protein